MLKMKWNATLANTAKLWANICSQNHSPNDQKKINGFSSGENLYMSQAAEPWTNIIQSWYREGANFEYGKGSINGKATGHYTQVVWYRSNEIGCAFAHCPTSKYNHYYVCQYFPAGNVEQIINTPYKKGNLCKNCPNNCENGLCTNPCLYLDKYFNCADFHTDGACDPDLGNSCPATCNCKTEIK
uniref:Cysteine-rich venom protein tigrin-like n=1 Tax=Geotrypetes seraphini TaxID=260995 RepID=A0A6P8QZ55_GEOSA|nr:cysteine-rich venom protein tigrin-like [Geotrypetes seraphini]